MKGKVVHVLIFWFLMAGANIVLGQESFQISLEPFEIVDAPGVQSFAFGIHDGKWLIIGGRRDGLHQRQPFASFLASSNNDSVFVIDPVAEQVWRSSLATLPVPLQEQLQSTNLNFEQQDTILYIAGGYGYSQTENDHITYPYLTAVNIPEAIQAVQSGASLASAFRYTVDSSMQVTGGQMDFLEGTYYLVGGQKFIGRYNPMGPGHGPGFFQEYTNEIRKFRINDTGSSLAITDYTAVRDTEELHRRDYNMAPQVFPDGKKGFTVFSGVFQYTSDIPWHNVVNIDTTGYTPIAGFDQLLSQYHSAKLPIWDSTSNVMHTIFFGGMSRYYYDSTGVLVDDPNVPFVRTISKITRFPGDSLVEYELTEQMPGLVGAGSEFIPIMTTPFSEMEILDLNELPASRTLVGYIYGGIESSQENIFFINTGTQSWANSRIYKVYIDKSITATEEMMVDGSSVFHLSVFPNPVREKVKIRFLIPYQSEYVLELLDAQGKILKQSRSRKKVKGAFEESWRLDKLSAGSYYIRIHNEAFSQTVKIVRE